MRVAILLCGAGTAAPFAVRALHGEHRIERSGVLSPRRFEPIVLELA